MPIAHINLKTVQYFISTKPVRPLNIPIHSMALLTAILSQLAALQASWVTAHFWGFHSQSASHLCCLCSSVSQTHNCTRLLHQYSQPSSWQSKITWYNIVSDTAIAYVINDDAQTNQQTHRCRKCKLILEPSSGILRMQPAGNNTNC